MEFDWLRGVCENLHSEIIELYWILLPAFVTFLICLEFFRMPEKNPDAGMILKRAVVSMILLFSFSEVMNLIAFIADGVTNRVDGINQATELLDKLSKNYKSKEISWFDYREMILYVFSLISYMIAYLGVFVTQILIQFVWAVLYIVSPLMILMYISDRTAFVTMNLYKGLLHVATWKVFWSILAVILIELAKQPKMAEMDNFFHAILLNLCIGISMLFIPFATRSLITDGMNQIGTSMASSPLMATSQAVKRTAKGFGRGTVSQGKRATTNIGRKVTHSFKRNHQ